MTATATRWEDAFVGDPIGVVDPASPEVIERRTKRRQERNAKKKRRDVQGLRMVAVVAVVVNHLTGHPQGGFVGVDVFFVISGYLITGHLIREEVVSGRLSLLDFYRRRIRRLFPAALSVVVATVIASLVIFGSDNPRYHATWVDAVWATLFSANWRFISTGTDYFAAFGGESPLQHYWSLSVEEQFYVIWPLTLIAVLALARRKFGRERTVAVVAGGAAAGMLLCTASLIVAALESADAPIRAYFSTFSRGWELGLGALLAVAAPYVRGKRWQLTALSWAGLVIVLASLFLVTSANFPFPGAMLPCLGAAMVIMARSSQAVALNVVLTNRVSNYLGDISYSIYVVHLPVIVLSEAALSRTSLNWGIDLALAPTILGLSILLFHLVEDPIRNSRWLEPRRQRGFNVTAGISRARPAMIAVSLTVIGIAALTLAITPGSSRYADLANAIGRVGDEPRTGKPTPELDALSVQIRSALLAQSYPRLDPSLSHVDGEPTDLLLCGDTQLGSAAECSWGSADPEHTIYLVGDSTSVAYTPAFRNIVEGMPGWQVRALGGFGCGFGDRLLAEGEENQHVAGCPARNEAVLAAIRAAHPDLLVVTNVLGSAAYANAVDGQLDKLAGDYGKLVMLPAPPRVIGPGDCYTTTSAPVDCAATVPSIFARYLINERLVARKHGGTLIDPTRWYCFDDRCPIFVGSTPTRRDAQHTTTDYAEKIAPVIAESFRNADLFS